MQNVINLCYDASYEQFVCQECEKTTIRKVSNSLFSLKPPPEIIIGFTRTMYDPMYGIFYKNCAKIQSNFENNQLKFEILFQYDNVLMTTSYQAKGIVIHTSKGTQSSHGHYFTYRLANGSWWVVNDITIQKVQNIQEEYNSQISLNIVQIWGKLINSIISNR